MNDMLRQRYTQLAERHDAMTLRERGLIFFSVMAVLYFFSNSLVLTPIFKYNQQQEQILSTRHTQVKKLEEQIQQALNGDKNDVAAEQQRRLQALRDQLAQHDPALAGANRSLVSPTEMVELVEQILLRNRALQVIHFENLPPELLETSTPGSVTAGAAAAAGIFRHGMQIELRGRYVDIVHYLHELESLPWKMYWGRFALSAEDYPNSRMTLVIYTLSLRPGWVGT